MLRLQSQQAFKALRSPLRSPLHSPLRVHLRNPLQLSVSRHVHNDNNILQAPFSGPPTYDTIRRRFSSQPNPAQFYATKWSQEARERGDFVDIHDVTGVGPTDYDVLITDVTDKKLRSELSELMGIEYLAKATEAEANEVLDIGNAIIFGHFRRTMFPCVVSHEDKAHWVFFLVDNGSPGTYLSEAASKLLNVYGDRPTLVKIAGRPQAVQMSPIHSHFHDINIMGTDFANAYNMCQFYNFKEGTAQLLFSEDWDVVRKSML